MKCSTAILREVQLMEPPSPRPVSIRNESARSLDLELVRRGVLAACSTVEIPAGEISILLTSSEAIRTLNSRFRAIDEPTDVLTFPAEDPTGNLSGDIAISTDVAHLQSKLRGVSIHEEIAFLAIHGVLHLGGYDDHEESDRAAMVAKMNAVAQTAGLLPDHEWHSRLHEAVS
jgi:probable rRNA maturation factor